MRARHVCIRGLTVQTDAANDAQSNPEMTPFRPEDEGGGILNAIVDASDDATSCSKADHAGRWMFHCHIACHMEAELARTVEYAERTRPLEWT